MKVSTGKNNIDTELQGKFNKGKSHKKKIKGYQPTESEKQLQ